MDAPVNWFMLQTNASLAGLWLGIWAGRGPSRRMWLWLGVALGLLLCWTWFKHNPSLAVLAIPPTVLYYIEGTGAVPLFMLMMGLTYAHSRLAQHKRLATLSMVLGAIYFLQGGLWMLQSTPTELFADTVKGDVVIQSQEYSCVPAACATALRGLDVTTSEAEMAQLTQVRPGTGATLIRAAQALRQKLADQSVTVHVLDITYDQLPHLAGPLLTPLQLEVGRQHMVVLRRFTEHGAWVADPSQGEVFMAHEQLEPAFTQRVIAFDR